jgi:hypothetical protein
MSTYDDAINDSLFLSLLPIAPIGYGVTVVDQCGADDAFGSMGWGVYPQDSVGIGEPFFAYAFLPGAIVDEDIRLHPVQGVQAVYSPALADAFRVLGNFTHATPVALMEGLGVYGVFALARAVTVLQRLGLRDVFGPNAVQGVSLVELATFSDAVLNFFGMSDASNIGLHDAFSPQFMFNRVLVDYAGLGSTLLANTLFLRVICDDVDVEDANIVQMIYEGDPLLDGFQITAGMVDPGGGFTTWAVNTRTGAVTEYQNFQFNSFVQLGSDYYGANDDGLWLLNSQTDDGENIPTDIKGAMLSLGGSRFTQLDGVYLGMRVDDNARDFVLKLILPNVGTGGSDKTYIYQFNPKDMRTTRINIGKGLRTRYLQWELLTPGADYDLDSIEFIPIISKRRV